MTTTFQKFSGLCGILAGAAGLLYLAAFFALRNPAALLPSLALLAVGLFASAVIVALYQFVRGVDEGFALWGLLLGIGGAGGAVIHAGFDLSNNLHPPAAPFGYASPVDPRGLLTFAVTGAAIWVLSWLITRGEVLPRAVGYLGMALGVLLILLYVAYLILLDASNPVVMLLVILSGILQPLWYLWVGWLLLQGETRAPKMVRAAKSR